MSFKKFLFSRAFIFNLALAVLLVGGILFLTLQSLKSYTRHGQSFPVPNFRGLVEQEANAKATQNNLKVVIIDSVFSDKVKPGEVVEQLPEAGFGVKENRTILLTINSTNKEKVVLPKLTDISYRQALVLAENCGLLVGEISYQPSEYNNLVLKIEQDTVEVFQGSLLLKGSTINFTVGRNQENEQTALPNLKGLKTEIAKEILTDAMLNLGVLIYDKTILTTEDSTNAVIWRQRPDVKSTRSVKLGTSVDLWITVDKEKIARVTEAQF
jgi:beta-lactam-binding protein with PASTA domain